MDDAHCGERIDLAAAAPQAGLFFQEWDGPAEPEQNRDELVDLRRSLDLLDPKLRTVVVLRFFEDMKLEDIAHVVRAPLSTVKSRLYRALAQLRVDLEQKEDL